MSYDTSTTEYIARITTELATLRAELAQIKANYAHLQETSTQAGMELINERDGLRELLAQCRGEREQLSYQKKMLLKDTQEVVSKLEAERDTLKGEVAGLKRPKCPLCHDTGEHQDGPCVDGEPVPTITCECERGKELERLYGIATEHEVCTSHRLLLDEMAGALAWLEEYFRRNIDVGGRHSCPWCYRKNEGHPWRTINHSPGCALAALTKYQQQCGEKV